MRRYAKASSAGSTSGLGGSPGSVRVRIAFVVTCLLALALGATVAFAAKPVNDTFGTSGTGNSQFSTVGGLAVEQDSGDVFAQDAGNNRIQRLDSDGDFISQIGPGSAGATDLNFAFVSTQIALDEGDDSLYVTDYGNNLVKKFNAAGAFVVEFGESGNGDLSGPQGVAVAPDGSVYVADTNNNRIARFSAVGVLDTGYGSGGFVGTAGSGDGEFSSPTDLAVDSTGRLYVADSGNGRVQRFTSAGAFDEIVADDLSAGGQSPSHLALDRTDDHLYVSAYEPGFSEQRIFEYAPASATFDDSHGNGNAFGFFASGLAVNDNDGPIYVANGSSNSVFVLDAPGAPSPDATIAPITTFDDHTATFSGTVDTQGNIAADWVLEYSSDGGSSWSQAASGSVAENTGPQPVSASVTGLEANKHYDVRLTATKPFGIASDSDQTDFTTGTDAPLVQALAADNRSDTMAWIGARINPQNSPTTYYVEYTLASDATYASSTKVPFTQDADAGSGGSFTTVFQLVTGLSPETLYRFRVVAANDQSQQSLGPDRTFKTAAALPSSPPGRGYEMVSPLDKNGGDIENDVDFNKDLSRAADSGDAVAYNSFTTFAGASGSVESQYIARRGSQGWSTLGLNPPQEPIPGIAVGHRYMWLTSDLSQALGAVPTPTTPHAFLQDTETAGVMPLSSPSFTPTGAGAFGGVTAGSISPDGSHAVFNGDQRLLSEAPLNGRVALYEWSNGQLELASILPDGGLPDSAAYLGGYHETAAVFVYPGDHPISEDGSRIFFGLDGSSSLAPGGLFVREDGATTTAISASEATGDDSSFVQSAAFQLASADGSRAIFTSDNRLTDDAVASNGSPDLYLWDSTAPIGNRLTDLTTADPGGAGVGMDSAPTRGGAVAGASEDASRVYFVASGDLAPGAIRDEPNLYLWSEGAGIRHVATLDPADGSVWSLDLLFGDESLAKTFRDARVTADGGRLLFASRARLTAYNNVGHRQLYLYDAGDDRLTCVSCVSTQPSSSGDASLLTDSQHNGVAAPFLARNLTEDGTRVFFDSAEALVPADTNGNTDVYSWTEDEGVRLISTGRGGSPSKFLDASADGRDVFFTTGQRLVGADQDELRDLYDARVGGGFPEPIPPSGCEGDACQPPPIVPSDPTPGSSTHRGPGNPAPKLGTSHRSTRCSHGRKRVKRKCVRKAHREQNRSAGTTRGTGR